MATGGDGRLSSDGHLSSNGWQWRKRLATVSDEWRPSVMNGDCSSIEEQCGWLSSNELAAMAIGRRRVVTVMDGR